MEVPKAWHSRPALPTEKTTATRMLTSESPILKLQRHTLDHRSTEYITSVRRDNAELGAEGQETYTFIRREISLERGRLEYHDSKILRLIRTYAVSARACNVMVTFDKHCYVHGFESLQFSTFLVRGMLACS